MVGEGVEEELGPTRERHTEEWLPPSTATNLDLSSKDGSSSRLLFLTVQYVGEDGTATFSSGLEGFSDLESRVVNPLDPSLGCDSSFSSVYRPSTPLLPPSGSGGYMPSASPTPPPGECPGMIVSLLGEQVQLDNYVMAATSSATASTADDSKLLLLAAADPVQPDELIGGSGAEQRVELILGNGTIAYGIVESTDSSGTKIIQIPREYLIASRTQNTGDLSEETVSEQDTNGQSEAMQDENGHIRALFNTLKEQGLVIDPGDLRLETGLDQAQPVLPTPLLEQTPASQPSLNVNATATLQNISQLLPPPQKRFWCEECNELLKTDCQEHQINRKISDKPVPSRARATLPATYLAIQRILDTNKEEYGVFAKKTIPKRTQFGPMEGVIIKNDDGTVNDEEDVVTNSFELELSIETESGELKTLDVSNEHMSNWMRFVRAATAEKLPNLLLSQLGSSLFFTTTHMIHVKEELFLWYSPAYAQRRNLPTEPPTVFPCSTCGEKLKTHEELIKHSNCHKQFKSGVYEDFDEFFQNFVKERNC